LGLPWSWCCRPTCDFICAWDKIKGCSWWVKFTISRV